MPVEPGRETPYAAPPLPTIRWPRGAAATVVFLSINVATRRNGNCKDHKERQWRDWPAPAGPPAPPLPEALTQLVRNEKGHIVPVPISCLISV